MRHLEGNFLIGLVTSLSLTPSLLSEIESPRKKAESVMKRLPRRSLRKTRLPQHTLWSAGVRAHLTSGPSLPCDSAPARHPQKPTNSELRVLSWEKANQELMGSKQCCSRESLRVSSRAGSPQPLLLHLTFVSHPCCLLAALTNLNPVLQTGPRTEGFLKIAV